MTPPTKPVIEPAERPEAVWAWASILCPIVAYVLGVVAAFSARSQLELLGFIYIFAAVGAACGALCAALSFWRRERRWLVLAVGLVLSLGPILYLGVALVIYRSNL